MREKSSALDHREMSTRERANHLLGPLHWEELVIITPDESDRRTNLLVEPIQSSH